MAKTKRKAKAGRTRVASPAGALSTIWAHRVRVVRAWLIFVVTIAVLIQVLVWARPFTDNTLTAWIASGVARVLWLFGADGRANGTLVTSTLGSVEIVRECTGVYPTALFVAAVAAYACSWRRKLVGVLFGVVAIQAINLVRILSLCYIHTRFPESFMTAHLVVWQSLVVFLTALAWLVWAVEIAGRPGRYAA